MDSGHKVVQYKFVKQFICLNICIVTKLCDTEYEKSVHFVFRYRELKSFRIIPIAIKIILNIA